MIDLIFAAAFTFTATATGLEKGAPVEFYWVDKNSDRDYEALFILDDLTQVQFRQAIEKAGMKPGKAVDATKSVVWPVGCPVKITPYFTDYLEVKLPEGYSSAPVIYTGGMDGTAAFAFYSLNESPFVFNGIYPQGDVYNAYKVSKPLKKGEKVKFTVTWNESDRPKSFAYNLTTNNVAQILKEMRQNSSKGEIDVRVSFDGSLTFDQSEKIAKALAILDSPRIKINGVRPGGLFFRSFLPKISWLTRKDRLVQPFELTLGDSPEQDRLVFIEEDWKVEGDDPKLTPKTISFDEAKKKEKTTTCFIFAKPETRIDRLEKAMARLKGSAVDFWYVFRPQ